MRRRPEHSYFLLKQTVPMLFAIGAVLSVLLLFFPDISALGIGALSAWGGVILLCAAALVLRMRKLRNPPADRTEEERDRFLSDVAHELKTPLTVIRGCAEIMADGAVPAEEFPEYCRRIQRETEAMSRLVGDLLDVSRLRTGRVRFEPRDVELSCLCRSVCDSLGTVAGKKEVEVLFVENGPKLPVLLLDYDRIRQLLVILLDNAVKHTDGGGRVTLALTREGETVVLRVSDTGHGIAAEDLPYVFERFYKADPERGGLAVGSGIGLSLARQIVLLHGGTVDVTSEKEKGTCFTVRLPFREYKENTDL